MPAKSTANLLARALLIFVGLFALLIGYYWVHKPFDVSSALLIGGALLDVATVAALFVIAGGIGRTLLSRIDLTGLSRAERLALEGGIGLGVVALAALIFGLIGLFRPLILWALLIIAALLLRRAVIDGLRDLIAVVRSALRVESVGQGLVVGYCALMLALALVIALAPPAHWDSLTYHLIAPTRYLTAGAITPQPDNFYLGLSQNVEMLYGITIGIFGRDTAAAPVHFGIGVLALLATAGLVRRFAGKSAGGWAALLLLSAYNLWALFGWAYVDLATMLYGALMLTALTTWRERRDMLSARGWLIVIGVMVGLAVGVKYAAGMIGVAAGLFILIHQPRRVIGNGLIVAAAALLIFAPWAVKGVALYGNPLYPFAFGGVNWNPDRMRAFQYSAYDLVGRGEAWQLPILPISAAIFGQDNADGFGFTAGTWLLTLFLLLPLVWAWLEARARVLARTVLIFAAPLVLYWAVMAAVNSVGIQTRLMVMALPAFAVAGSIGLHGLAQFPKKPIDINFIVRVALTLTLVLGVIDALQTTLSEKAPQYLLGQTSLDDYMYANTGAYYNAMTHLPAESKVLLMWEPRGYDCPPDVTCTADVLFDHWKLPIFTEGLTPHDVFARYRADGYDYLLLAQSIYDAYVPFSTYPQIDATFPAEIEQHMTPVWTDSVRYTLYGWKSDG